NARTRWLKAFCPVAFIKLCLELHPTHAAPGECAEYGSDDADNRDLRCHSRPATTLKQRIADNLDVVASPNERRDPAQSGWDVLNGKNQTREQEHEQKTAQRNRLHGCHLAGNRRS